MEDLLETNVSAIDVRLGRHRFWYLTEDSRWLPQVRGGATGDPDPDDEDDDDLDEDGKPKVKPEDESKFTQKDLDKYATREHSRGKRAATKELMEKFGFKTAEEAEQFIKDARAKVETDDGDATERQRKLDERERNLEEAEAKANAKAQAADIRSALIAAGAPADKDKLADLTAMVKVDEDADEDDIADAVDALKKRWANLFKSTDDPDDEDDDDDLAPDTGHTSGGGRRKRPSTDNAEARAKARVAERHGTPKP